MRRRARWPRWTFVLVVAAVLGATAASVPTYVEPQLDKLHRADAILVLGGPSHERYTYGLDLAHEGLAGRVLLSDPSGGSDEWLDRLCGKRFTFSVVCFDPDPATTAGEAKTFRDFAIAGGWNSVIVVTFTPHVSRARYTIQRCFGGEVMMAASPANISAADWVWQSGYQTAGYVRSLFQQGC
ncbi:MULTISPECIES: YdcF family protein [unclassified Rhodococcus (in: high G+C Gram-positive bacteria)]|uniref:YdcF family protein n=1 Tax=unclassified Rhodococcus (in: high G+C Gram-positive bacteria) TaxID=192944 RepID=UPI002898C1E8|nr:MULTISPECIES: YdcF family protein [unclassified Rhodococcus (in: high G+C Gram-positive bacteria)]